MKVILQKDVKNVGKVGDVVNVATGYARNFLFPRRLAVLAAEKSVKAWEHLKKVAEIKKKKAQAERRAVLDKLAGVTLSFKLVTGEHDKVFGSVTTSDISRELEGKGFSIDRRDIQTEPIRQLGQHKVTVSYGEGMSAELTVVVEKQ